MVDIFDSDVLDGFIGGAASEPEVSDKLIEEVG